MSGHMETPGVRPGLPRVVDAALAAVVFLIVMPLLALCAAAIVLDSRGPVLFRQIRVGRGGRPFHIAKFRTMFAAPGGPQFTAGDDRRITRVGRILRSAKVDELPALWNVVRGDMALVGPRPEVPRYVDLNDVRWRRALAARPGLTDPVTVRLRNEQAILGAVDGDREAFYSTVLVPYKLQGYAEFLASRTWKTDLGVLCHTAVAIFAPNSLSAPRLT